MANIQLHVYLKLPVSFLEPSPITLWVFFHSWSSFDLFSISFTEIQLFCEKQTTGN